jgi:hypothetical protein
MSGPTLLQLQNELVERVKATTTFSRAAFDVYDLKDMQSRAEEGVRWPIAGVAFERSYPLERDNPTAKKATGARAGLTLRHEFSVIIGTDYKVAGKADLKDDMLTLLDEIRAQVMGYRGANSRPWALLRELPIDGDLDGVIFYGQLWATDVVQVGAYVEN